VSAANVGKRCRWGRGVRVGVLGRDPQPYEKREGVIVAFVPAGDDVAVAEQKATGRSFSEVDATSRIFTFDRYLVRVDRRGIDVRGDGGRPLKPKWFAPRASIVEIVEPPPPPEAA
jgi:hypothetical protein